MHKMMRGDQLKGLGLRGIWVLTRELIDSNLIATSMDHPTHIYDR